MFPAQKLIAPRVRENVPHAIGCSLPVGGSLVLKDRRMATSAGHFSFQRYRSSSAATAIAIAWSSVSAPPSTLTTIVLDLDLYVAVA